MHAGLHTNVGENRLGLWPESLPPSCVWHGCRGKHAFYRLTLLHLQIFLEACSALTRVAACTLALSPIRDTLIEGSSHFVTSMTAPIASGGSESPGGACTHWKAPSCHGAHLFQTLTWSGLIPLHGAFSGNAAFHRRAEPMTVHRRNRFPSWASAKTSRLMFLPG